MFICTKETAKYMNPLYFKAPSNRDSEPTRCAVGTFMPLSNNATLFVVRVRNRRKKVTATREYYVIDSRDYRVASISWANGHVTEWSIHPTRNEADAALKVEHAALMNM